MKNALVFRGPAHHGQLLRPIEKALEARKWTVNRWTADVEANFQTSLNGELGNNYLWLPDYFVDKGEKLYASHVQWWRDKIAKPSPINLVLAQVLDRIVLFTCREWAGIENMIEKTKPSLGFALHSLNRWAMIQGHFCVKNKIPFYTFQEGLYYGQPWIYKDHTKYGKSLIWGDATKRKLMEAGCPSARVEVVGHPDLGKRIEEAGAIEYGKDLPEAAQQKDLILLFVGNLEVKSPVVGLCDGLEKTNFHVVVIQHQLSSLPHIQAIKTAFTHPSVTVIPALASPGLYWKFLKAAKMFLHIGCSTTVLEWAYTRKPQGQFPASMMHRDFAAEGISVNCEGLKVLDALYRVDTRWEADGYPERQDKFVKDEIDSVDSAEKIVDIMVSGSLR